MRLRRYEDGPMPVRRSAIAGSTGENLTIESSSDARVPALERALLLTHCLARECSAAGVWEALSLHAAGVMRGWKSICILARESAAPDFTSQDVRLSHGVLRHFATPHDEWGGDFAATLLDREGAARNRGTTGLHALFEDSSVQRVACMTVGERGLLAIIERRTDRVFVPDDWYRLRAIAVHADATLERISLAGRNSRHAP